MSAASPEALRSIAASFLEVADHLDQAVAHRATLSSLASDVTFAEQRLQNLETAFIDREARYVAREQEHKATLESLTGERVARTAEAKAAAAILIKQAEDKAAQIIAGAEETAEIARASTREVHAKHEAAIADIEARRKQAEVVIATEQRRLAEIRGDADTEQKRLDTIRAAIAKLTTG